MSDRSEWPGGTDERVDEQLNTVVIGGGQAGPAIAMFTPRRYDSPPGLAFPGPADTCPNKDEVADYQRDYATAFDLRVRRDTTVTPAQSKPPGLTVHTTQQVPPARRVVVATGAFHIPFVPALNTGLSNDVLPVQGLQYRNPAALLRAMHRAGRVLVVGGAIPGYGSPNSPARDLWHSLSDHRSGRRPARAG